MSVCGCFKAAVSLGVALTQCVREQETQGFFVSGPSEFLDGLVTSRLRSPHRSDMLTLAKRDS